MRKTQILAALLLGGVLTFSSCSQEAKNDANETADQVGEDMEDGYDEAKSDINQTTEDMSENWQEDKATLQAQINQGVDKLDRKIEEADAKIKDATADEKIRWEKRKKELREERDELKDFACEPQGRDPGTLERVQARCTEAAG